MTEIWPEPRRRSAPATPRCSRSCSTPNVGWAFATVGLILAVVTLASGCETRRPVLTADREITALADGGYRVTASWLKERYELERTLRLRVERCEEGH